MQEKSYTYDGYDLNYYYRPGKWMNDEELRELQQKLLEVNITAKCNFKYGVFAPQKTISQLREIYNDLMVCTIVHDGILAGFFYNYIVDSTKIEEKPIVHQGLVIIAKNIGQNVLYAPYTLSNTLIHQNIGDYFVTSISATPSIIGEVENIFKDVWPAARASSQVRPKKSYADIANVIFNSYVIKMFPHPEALTFDSKRFVIISDAKEMGFERDLRKLSRHKDLIVNLFCQYWIDYTRNEDMIQVGLFDEECMTKNKTILDGLKINEK